MKWCDQANSKSIVRVSILKIFSSSIVECLQQIIIDQKSTAIKLFEWRDSLAQEFSSYSQYWNLQSYRFLYLEVNLCGKQIVVQCYADCYKLTLEQVIESRKKSDVRFTTGELWYLISSLVDLSLVLAEYSLLFGVYLTRNLFLSSEGYLKLYLFHLLAQDNHILYYHALASDSRHLYKFLPLAPQCLLPLASHAKLQCDESLLDVFGIGMLALEAMLFGSTRKYYLSQCSNEKKLTFNEEQLKRDIKELRGIYPHNLMILIENMVQVDPKKRWSFALARDYIKKAREEISISGAIKLFQDEQNPIAPKLSYQSIGETDPVGFSVCQKIQSKLECQPLRELRQEKYWSCGNTAYKESCLRKRHKSNNMGVSLTGRRQSGKLILSSLVMGNGLR